MTAPDAPPRRLRELLLQRPSRAQVAIAALCGLLGFGLVTQVQATSATGGLAAARPDDLLGILSDLGNRADRLRADVLTLERSEARLRTGSDREQAALREARDRVRTLGVLTGTLAATGPGIVVTISDPRGSLGADVLVDTLQELRDAGAEAIELSGVRVVASTWILDRAGGGVTVDDHRVVAPYRLTAIGAPQTLAGALGIPGGVLDTVQARPGARAAIQSSRRVSVTALRRLSTPRYARPAR